MALTDYRTYTMVCGTDKFPSDADINTFNIQQIKQHSNHKKPKNDCEHVISLTEYEWQIAIAVSRLETGNFTSYAFTEGNNYGGISIDETPLQYSTRAEGLNAFISNLKDNYFDEGLNTPESIGNKYCPCNPSWAELVTELMQEDNNYYYETYFKEETK